MKIVSVNPWAKLCMLSLTTLSLNSYAGGLDNNSRSFNVLFSDKDVIDVSYGHTSVPMKANIQKGAGSTNDQVASGDIVGRFERPQVAFKMQVTPELGCAAQIEKPYAVTVAYSDDRLAYDNLQAPIATEYDSDSFTLACGYDFSLTSGILKVFAGPKLQKVSGYFSQDITAFDLGRDDNLEVNLKGDNELGYVAGFAYSIPEIALRFSVLYHSQIDYKTKGNSRIFLPLSLINPSLSNEISETNVTADTFTPQSVELAFQSGIAKDTLAFVKLRWSEYSKLKTLNVKADDTVMTQAGMTLGELAQANAGFNKLINPKVGLFSNDTLDYSFGLGHRFNDEVSGLISYAGGIKIGSKDDSIPLGADSKSLRLPGDTKHSLVLGGSYQFSHDFKLSAGLGYTFIDAYRVQTPGDEYRAEFSKTESTSVQLGLSYFL